MIVSDAHRFVFIHVPKCAGTTVRHALTPYHDQAEAFDRIVDLPGEGETDLAHLSLRRLERLFPEMLEKVDRYAAFAILRDPLVRFPSSMGERLAHQEGRDIVQMTLSEVRREARAVLERLLDDGEADAPDLVHFQRQCDFVRLRDRTLVDHLVPLERLDLLEDAFARILAQPISFAQPRNARLDPTRVALGPGPADRISPTLARAWRRVAPPGLRRRAANALFPRGYAATRRLIKDRDVRRLIRRHYADDFELHAQAQTAAAARPPRRNPQEG